MPSNYLETIEPDVQRRFRSREKRFRNTKLVTWRNGGFYYPKNIPTPRAQFRTATITILFSMILFLWDIFTSPKTLGVVYFYSCGLLFPIILELIKRTISIFEEFRHFTSRYENNLTTFLKDAYHFSTKVCVIIVACILYIIYYISTDDFLVPLEYPKLVRVALASYLLCNMLRIYDCPLNTSLWLSENNGLNYGSGMAYSFFHGYLKLVLQQTGSEEKYLTELMKEFEGTNGVKFKEYKLFILIPQSLNVFVSLENVWSPSVEESKSLPEKQKTVAGVQNRVYKNAVYKIVDKKEKIYISAEYATPLKTFKDVVDNVGKHSSYFNKYKKEIILQFYLTLADVLKSTGLNKYCELVYYEDSYEENNKICYYDVGQILLTMLNSEKTNKKGD